MGERSLEELQAELKRTRVTYAAARRGELDGIGGLRFARHSLLQAQSGLTDSKERLSNAEYREERAQRAAHEAKRDVRDALQKGAPVQKLQAPVKRTEQDARGAIRDLQRAQDIVSGKQQDVERAEQELVRRSAEADARVRRAQELMNKLKDLQVLQDIARAKEAEKANEPPDLRLAITKRAVTALKELLDSLVHDRNQAIRLTSASENGAPKLALDNTRDGDQVVAHEEQPVLLVESPLPDRLRGATLDVSEAPDGSGFVLSRPVVSVPGRS